MLRRQAITRPELTHPLSIGDVAARTGVPVTTLRTWETRYGIPVPHREMSGHRRYSTADVDLVLEVPRQRSSGLAMPSAIERARGQLRPTDSSVFSGLRDQHRELTVQRLPKPTLLALCRAIEDECCAQAERPPLFAGFQRVRHYHASRRRWDDMSATARGTYVFADFERPGADSDQPLEVAVPPRRLTQPGVVSGVRLSGPPRLRGGLGASRSTTAPGPIAGVRDVVEPGPHRCPGRGADLRRACRTVPAGGAVPVLARARGGATAAVGQRTTYQPRLRPDAVVLLGGLRALEIEVGEARMILRPRPGEVPPELAGVVSDRDVVDARMTSSHQSALVEQPVLVAIGTEPGAALVVPLVGEPGRDAIGVEGPHLLDQPVVQLLGPLASQEFDDGSTALEELRPVSPAAVLGVRQRDLLRITSVPGVFCRADLGDRVLAAEGWNGWSRCHGSAPRLQSRSLGRHPTGGRACPGWSSPSRPPPRVVEPVETTTPGGRARRDRAPGWSSPARPGPRVVEPVETTTPGGRARPDHHPGWSSPSRPPPRVVEPVETTALGVHSPGPVISTSSITRGHLDHPGA